jgi:hypothetical protein
MLWMRGALGSVLEAGLAVDETDATDHFGEPRGPVESAPAPLGALAQAETMVSAVRRDRQPLVLVVRGRTVAKVLSMGFVTGMMLSAPPRSARIG